MKLTESQMDVASQLASPTPTTPTPAKVRKTRKVKSARAPRVVDPAEAEIKAQAKQAIAAHRLSLKSDAMLAKIGGHLETMSAASVTRLGEMVAAKLLQLEEQLHRRQTAQNT